MLDAAEESEVIPIMVLASPEVSPLSAFGLEGKTTTPIREVEGSVATSCWASELRKGMVPVFHCDAPNELERSTTSTTSVREHVGGGDGGGGEGDGGGGEGGGEISFA